MPRFEALAARRREAAARPAVALCVAVAALAPAPAPAADPCGVGGISKLQTLERRSPDYPDGARSAGLEGYVDVDLTVLRDGRTGWVRVRRAEPAGLFEQAALEAVRDWRFEPPQRDGEIVECSVSTRLRFALSDEVMPGAPGFDGPGRTMPAFPESARAAAIEGYVRVEYGATPDGKIADLAILESVPRGAFDEAVTGALATWRFEPAQAPTTRTSREFRFRLPAYARPDPMPQHTPSTYPAALCGERPRGRVVLDVEIGADGRVGGAKVVEATPPGLFEREALRTAAQMKRVPARRAGQAVAAPGRVTIDFDPDRQCDADGGPGPRRRGSRGPRVGAAYD
jgi:TonB family protein